jgi:hypothetical protein
MPMIKKYISFIFLLILFLSIPTNTLAQSYLFQLEDNIVHVYWNEDGTTSLYYTLNFYNDPSGHPIEFVDLGLPRFSFDESTITAKVNGQPVSYISSSEYEGDGSGVAIALGNNAIQPGQRGTVTVFVPTVRDMLFQDDDDDSYASAVFAPTYFGSEYVYGNTNIEVTYHLPPGVQPDEPRWHSAPKGFPEEPNTGYDEDGRIIYTWVNPTANGHTEYQFGASFPAVYVPSDTIAVATVFDRTWINPDDFFGFLCCGGVFGFIVLSAILGGLNQRKRKLKYLPPKIRIEGHGIKRGLTAIEAAVLMEHPPDKVLTMILFSVIKKGAAQVTSRDPLKLELLEPLPEGLRTYETKFLEAFNERRAKDRRIKLQNLMISLIRSISKKMKGFSHKETVAYYKKIMEKAWQQVEAADTPEVKSQKFDDNMGWTMLDRDFDRRTQDVFRTGPVFVPMWWGRYDPGWSGAHRSTPGSAPSIGGGRSGASPALPNLPGGAFAASVVGGMQNFAGDVVGNITDFTSGVTNKTNPIPKSSSGSYRSGGGSSCACACACAGCACACAGGGR